MFFFFDVYRNQTCYYKFASKINGFYFLHILHCIWIYDVTRPLHWLANRKWRLFYNYENRKCMLACCRNNLILLPKTYSLITKYFIFHSRKLHLTIFLCYNSLISNHWSALCDVCNCGNFKFCVPIQKIVLPFQKQVISVLYEFCVATQKS